ncbi:hypothetical protein ACQY0O_003741 [Thecaphora frezii]
MASASTGVAAGLLDLPDSLLIDNLSPLLSNADLAALRQASKRSKALFDDEVLWKRKTLNDFHYPPHASARVGGWRKLYRGLARPQVWVWGQAVNGRLGLGHMLDRTTPQANLLRHLSHRVGGGIPFPMRNDIIRGALTATGAGDGGTGERDAASTKDKDDKDRVEADELGSVVELVAGGWSFHARTSTGRIIYWGNMNGEGYAGPYSPLRDPYKEVETPDLLDLPASCRIKQLSCGRSHAAALTERGDVLEWRAWGTLWKHEGLLPPRTNCGSPEPSILQLEAGWELTAILVDAQPASGDDTQDTQVYVWFPHWTEERYRQAYFAEEAESYSPRAWPEVADEARPAPIQSPAIRLPALRERRPSADEADTNDADAGAGDEQRQTLVRIAAGENFLLGLTQGGLVYRLDISCGLPDPADRQAPDGNQRSLAEAQRSTLLRRLERGEISWRLLPHFCRPELLRQVAGLKRIVEGKGDEQLRISHVSAHFRTFVVYTSDGAMAERGHGGGIVLLGDSDAGPETVPTVIPRLQDAGVIKVVLGDYHFGALTESGEVWTWGAWSKGALGLWHNLPRSEPGGATAEAESSTEDAGYDDYDDGGNLVPLPRIGRAGLRLGGQPFARAGSRAAIRQAARSGGGGGGWGGSGGSGGSGWVEGVSAEYQDLMAEREMPNRVEEPRAVTFRPLPAESGEAKPAKYFAFDVAFAGWHSSALVMEVDDELDKDDAHDE